MNWLYVPGRNVNQLPDDQKEFEQWLWTELYFVYGNICTSIVFTFFYKIQPPKADIEFERGYFDCITGKSKDTGEKKDDDFTKADSAVAPEGVAKQNDEPALDEDSSENNQCEVDFLEAN